MKVDDVKSAADMTSNAKATEAQAQEQGTAPDTETSSTEPVSESVATTPRKRNVGRIAIGVVLALAFFAFVNAAITFVYEPYGSRSQVSWTDYSQTKNIDTIIVGTSLVQHAMNPRMIDYHAGTHSFNLGTPAQTLEDSFIGIQTAWEDHHVKRAVLGLSYESLTRSGEPNAMSPYLRCRSFVVSPEQTLSAMNQMLWRYGASKTETSINILFPWVSNHIRPTMRNFQMTIDAKLSHQDLAQALEEYDPGWHYICRGHGARKGSLNYNSPEAVPLLDRNDELEGADEFAESTGEDGAEADVGNDDAGTSSASIDPDRANTLRDIFAYCEEHEIELVVMSTPLPVFNVIDPETHYGQLKHDVEELCAEWGLTYYDFSYAKNDLYKAKKSYVHDGTHFNEQGARAFSRAFGKFLARLDAGEDMSDLFMTDEELVESVDYISIVLLEDSVDEEGIHLHARPIAGPSVQTEFQFLARAKSGDEWEVIHDWSADPDFTYTPPERGTYGLRVNAHQIGSEKEIDRFRIIREMY